MSTCKRILIVTNGSLPRTASTFFVPEWEESFYRGLAAHFDRVSIVTDTTQHREKSPFLTLQEVHNIHFTEISGPQSTRWGRYLNSAVKLLPATFRIRKNRDFVYLFYPGRNSFLIGIFLRIFRKPYHLYVRGAVEFGGILGKIHRANIAGSSGNLVTGSYLLNQVLEINPASQLVAPMMNVGIDDLDSANQTRHLEEPPVILFVGQPNSAKGIHTFIETIAEVKQRGYDVKARIIGNANAKQVDDIEELLQANDILNNTEIIPGATPEEVRGHMKSSTMFLFPTKYAEGFPRVIYEALTLGLPVITTDRDMFKLVLRNGKNAILCKSDDISDFASAVETLLSSHQTRTALSLEGIQTMRQIFAAIPVGAHPLQVIEMATQVAGRD